MYARLMKNNINNKPMNKKVLILENAILIQPLVRKLRALGVKCLFNIDQCKVEKADIILVPASRFVIGDSNYGGETITSLMAKCSHENTRLILVSASKGYLDDISTRYVDEVDDVYLKSVSSQKNTENFLSLIKKYL